MMVLFFFFQAEDGIRDGHVTGVQTCALPILRGTGSGRGRGMRSAAHTPAATASCPTYSCVTPAISFAFTRSTTRSSRSEERREGKRVGLGGGGDRVRRNHSGPVARE